MGKTLLAILFVAFSQSTAVEPPAPLQSRSFVSAARSVLPPYDTSYLSLPKRAQLWGIFTPEVKNRYWIEDFDKLKMLEKKGELVEVSEVARESGVALRKSGRWPIAEKDLRNRDSYYYLRPAAAGLLVLVGLHMQDCGCAPLESTSLVRTWAYQKRLMKVNPTANVTKLNVPPTHVYGLAFDITRKDMSASCQREMLKFLRELTGEGKVIYFLETLPQAAFHVIALPQAHAELANLFATTAASLHAAADASKQK